MENKKEYQSMDSEQIENSSCKRKIVRTKSDIQLINNRIAEMENILSLHNEYHRRIKSDTDYLKDQLSKYTVCVMDILSQNVKEYPKMPKFYAVRYKNCEKPVYYYEEA